MKLSLKLLLLIVGIVFAQFRGYNDLGYLGSYVPYINAVNLGLMDGHQVVDKFGFNPDITTATDPEDIWEGGGLYTYDPDSTAPIQSIASSSALDNQLIMVQGLDSNGFQVTQFVQLNGQTRVALDSNLWRVFRLMNFGSTNIDGSVFCYTGTGTVPSIGDPEVRAIIDDGNNQTQMALYTIPRPFVGMLLRGELGMQYSGGGFFAGDEAVNLSYYSRRLGEVFRIKKTISLISSGNSIYQDTRTAPDVIPAMTDIRMTANEVSEDMGIWGAFDILLIHESKLDSAFLTDIGQPGY